MRFRTINRDRRSELPGPSRSYTSPTASRPGVWWSRYTLKQGQPGRPSVLMKLALRGPRPDQLKWLCQCGRGIAEAGRSRVPRWAEMVVTVARPRNAVGARCRHRPTRQPTVSLRPRISPGRSRSARRSPLREAGSSYGCCPDRSSGIATRQRDSWTGCFSVLSTTAHRTFTCCSRPGRMESVDPPGATSSPGRVQASRSPSSTGNGFGACRPSDHPLIPDLYMGRPLPDSAAAE